MDKIYIRDLSLRCIIGVFPEEREKKQDIMINIVMVCDLRRAGSTDCLDDAIDYKVIKKEIIAMVEASQFNLIETMADRVAKICLADRRVRRVTVTIDKPGALRFARSVAVEVVRPADGDL